MVVVSNATIVPLLQLKGYEERRGGLTTTTPFLVVLLLFHHHHHHHHHHLGRYQWFDTRSYGKGEIRTLCSWREEC